MKSQSAGDDTFYATFSNRDLNALFLQFCLPILISTDLSSTSSCFPWIISCDLSPFDDPTVQIYHHTFSMKED